MAKSRKKKNNLFSHTKSYSILNFKLYKRDYTIRNNKEKKNERQQLAKNTHNSMLYKKKNTCNKFLYKKKEYTQSEFLCLHCIDFEFE